MSKITNDGLTGLYSYIHMATVGVKGISSDVVCYHRVTAMFVSLSVCRQQRRSVTFGRWRHCSVKQSSVASGDTLCYKPRI